MKFTKTRKAVAFLLLFAMLLAVAPTPAFATGMAEQATEEAATADIATELPPEVTKATETETAALQASEETEALNATVETTENETSEAVSEPVQIEQKNKTEAREVTSADESVETDNGPGKDGLYTDAEGNQFYLVSNGTRALMRIYKRYWGYVDFSGPGSHGNFPYLATSLGFTNQTDYGTDGDWVYCIQFNQSAADGYDDSDSEDLSQSSYWNSLADYQKNGILLAASYGAQNGNGHNTIYDYMAAQLIIWEYQLGWRTSATTTTSSHYNMITSGWGYIKDEYNRILSDIGKAEKKPTFNTYSHTFDQTGTSFEFEDANAALSQGAWKIVNTPSELSASIVGNKLRVSANSYFTGTRTITLKRDIPGSAKNAFVYKTGSQHAITGTDNTTVTVTLEINAVKSVRIKKTSSASASVMACIQGNPRYTLQGAVYEIRQGSATGPVVETLTTDANGNATGTVKYAVNTVLYAVEKTAPSGYLLNSTPFPLTVSADSSQNVFNVSDVPTFDPQRLEIKKTGTSSEYIPNTIFKADFYASTWMDSNYLQRTWYLKSDSNGRVRVDDAHLLSSYGGNSSDPLFKPDGTVSFPLGCVYIQEIQAADGYITPVGIDAGVLIFINQPTSGGAAEAYWGDAAGQPITMQNPTGIYKMENDSDGTVITAENQEIYGTPPSIKKVDPSNVSLEGAVFEVTYYNAAYSSAATDIRTWYFKTNANGTFELKNSYLASGYTSTGALFPVDKIPLGLMRIKEVEAPAGFETSDTVAFWRMKQNGNTDKSYWVESDGYTETTSYGDDVYVPTGSSSGELYVKNMPIPGTMTMKKTLPADIPGGVEGYYFNLFRAESSTVWYGRTDASGKIYKTNASHAAVAEGSRVYQFEGLLDGTYSLRELLSQRDFKNTKTTKIRITTSGGTTASVDLTYQGNALNWDTNGDCFISRVPITGLNGGGTLSIEITNAPIYGGPPTLVKKDASTDLPLEGAIFQVDYYSSEAPTATTFERRWFLRSDDDGCVTLDAAHLVNTSEYQSDELYETGKLPIGCIRVEEVEAPEGFRKSDSIGYWYMKLTNPQTFAVSNYWGGADGEPTDDYGEDAYVIDNELYVENTPSNTLTIRKTSSNGRIKGITFEVRQYVTGHGWLPLGDGTYVTGDGGKIGIPDLPAGTRVQIKEIVPDGSICLSQNPQEITLQVGDNPVNFENVDISLELVKTSTDGAVEGIQFEVEKFVGGNWTMLGTYTTGTNGKVPVETQYLAVGAKFRIKEIVPEDYICLSENPQIITLEKGKNTVTFANTPVVELKIVKTSLEAGGRVKDFKFMVEREVTSGHFTNWEPIQDEPFISGEDGTILIPDLELGMKLRITELPEENYECITENPVTITLVKGTNTVSFKNRAVVKLKIVKHNTDAHGPVDGFKFKIERKLSAEMGTGANTKERWEQIGGTYVTADGGIILIDEAGLLHEGDELRITEIDLGDYICLSENPQRITLELGENVVEFTNKLGIELEIIKESDDGKISNIEFTVERKKSADDYSLVGTYKTDADGKICIEDLELGETYRITETLPYGYETEHISQEITIHAGKNTVTFVNHLIECSITIVKVYEGTRVPLKEAGFKLYDERGEELAEGFTNENGELKFERLRVGNYTLKEFQAPPGFELDETEIPVELKPDKRDITIERENKIIPGLIRVHKETDKGQPMAGVKYLLEYSMDDMNTWLPIQSRDADSPVQCGYSTSANIVNGCITTGADGIAEFAGLAINNQLHTIKYRLTEVGTQDGYDLLAEPVFEGYLTEEQVELEYKVVNHRVFEMPMTGGNGVTMAAISSALAVLLALMVLLYLPKKREDNL